jgi:protease-4
MTKRSYFYRPKPSQPAEKPKRWNISKIIWRAVKKTCMVVGAMVLLSALLSTCIVLIVGRSAGPGAPLPKDMVLVFNMEEGLAEMQTKPSILDPFPFMQPTVRNVVDAIDRAATDDRVRALVFSLKTGVGMVHAQELRQAVMRFRQSGKPAKIYAPSFAMGTGGMTEYYLASAFDEIWMQPVGMLSITGMYLEMPFAQNALDKIGVQAQFFQREEYKSAMESFTRDNISPENREMLSQIINDWSSRMMDEIALSREIDRDMFAQLINEGIFTGEEALKLGLIDRLAHPDLIRPEIQAAATGNPEDETVQLYPLGDYAARKPAQRASADNKVALIYVVGSIVDSEGAGGRAGASEIAATISAASEDEAIKAIVVRVDSPGGSPTASETIRRALVRAQEKGKPVIISMGPVAASGGYWVAANADKIYAMPGTLTGSIGVVMGKFEVSDLWEKIGVNWEGPQFGANADMWSINQPFDEAATARLNVMIDSTYEAFLSRVAEGRNLTPEETRRIAKGRAYTGETAQELGLVDELGGLHAALDGAAKEIGFDDRTQINVVKMPRELGGLERLLELIGQDVSIGNWIGATSAKDLISTRQVERIAGEVQLLNESPVVVYDPLLAGVSAAQ